MLQLCQRPWHSPKAMFPWYRCQQTQSSSNRVAWTVETVSTKRDEWNFVCGYCAESDRSPDFIVRFDNTATCTGHQTSRSSCTADVSVVQSVFRALAGLFLLAVSVLGAAYLSVLRDNTVFSVFRGRVSVHQDGVLVCTWPNRRRTCSQCSLPQMINTAHRKGAEATPITYLNILLRLFVEHSKGQHIP